MKPGKYKIKVKDITPNIFQTLPEIEISLTLLPEVEEEPIKGKKK